MSSLASISVSLSDSDRRLLIEEITRAIRSLPSQQSAPLLVDADELARLLSMSRPTIDRLRAAGVIPSIGEGRLRRYNPNAVISALEANNIGVHVYE